MENPQDDPARRRPTGSEDGTAGLGSAAAGAGVADVGRPRGPRIEVLRAAPTTAPEAGSAAVTREPRIEVLEGVGRATPYADAAGVPPGRPEPAKASAGRMGGRPFRPTLLGGLALLALLILAGLLLFPYLRGGSEDSGEAATSAEATPAEVSDGARAGEDGQADEDPPLVEEPAAEQSAADAALSDQLYSPESGEAAPGDQSYPSAPRGAASGGRPYASEPRTATVTESRKAPNRGDAAPVGEPGAPTPPTKEVGASAAAAEEASAPVPPAGEAEALATVRAFYTALGAGDGASAARFVVSAKRRTGPLSAGELTRYYSTFRRPLQVRRVTTVDADTVRVAYDYVLADGRLCRGRSAVNVVRGDGGVLIGNIRAQGPC